MSLFRIRTMKILYDVLLFYDVWVCELCAIRLLILDELPGVEESSVLIAVWAFQILTSRKSYQP